MTEPKTFAQLTKEYVEASNAFDELVNSLGQDRDRGGETRAEFFAEIDRLHQAREDAYEIWLKALHDPNMR